MFACVIPTATFVAISRLKDSALGKATAALLTANVLFLLYLLTYLFDPYFPSLQSPDFFLCGSVFETLFVTPIFTFFSVTFLRQRRLKGFARTVVSLIAVNVLLNLAVLYVAGANF